MENIFAVAEETLQQLSSLRLSIEAQYRGQLIQPIEAGISASPRGCTGHNCTNTCSGGCLHTCTASCMQSPFGIM